MIDIFFGNNITRKKKEILEWVESKKNLGYQIEKYETDSVSLEVIEQSLLGGGLFDTKTAFVLYYVDILDEFIKMYNKLTPSIQKDACILFIFEDNPKIKDKHIHSKEYSLPVVEDGTSKKVFALADAIGRKDKKQTWLLYRELIEFGLDPLQGIYSPLVWSLNNIALIQRDPKSTHGMKPYPLKKAQGFVKNHSKDEIDTLLRDLLFLYQSRKQGEDIEARMEEILLKIT
jgi:hypothetical protein